MQSCCRNVTNEISVCPAELNEQPVVWKVRGRSHPAEKASEINVEIDVPKEKDAHLYCLIVSRTQATLTACPKSRCARSHPAKLARKLIAHLCGHVAKLVKRNVVRSHPAEKARMSDAHHLYFAVKTVNQSEKARGRSHPAETARIASWHL